MKYWKTIHMLLMPEDRDLERVFQQSIKVKTADNRVNKDLVLSNELLKVELTP